MRLRDGALEEVDEGHASVKVDVRDVRSVRLQFGNAAERLWLQLGLGIALIGAGLWLGFVLLTGRWLLIVFGVALSFTGAGVAVLAIGLRRRFYLAVETGSQRRKLAFAPAAEPRGLSVFLASLRKRGLNVETPANFLAQSRYAKLAALSGTLRTLRREGKAEGVSSFSLSVEERFFELLAEPFADWLASYLAGGARIANRQTLQYGTELLLTEVDGENLTLLASGKEPDQWNGDLTLPLLTMLRQRFVAESFAVQVEPPSPLLLVSVDPAAAIAGPVLMTRLETEEEHVRLGHSGWYISSVDPEHAEKRESVHMAIGDFARFRPDLVEFLSLPRGMSVGFVGDRPNVMRGEQNLIPERGSYMHCKIHGIELPRHLTGTA